nr:LamG-like jellyroll fold domain-containing protein [Candidatus Sigynarchaeota archaeon]
MISNAEANWRVQGSGTSQHTWAELVLRGAMRGTKYSWVGLGVEIQAPLVPGRIFASMQARVELDIEASIGSSDKYNITVAVQTASGLHVLRTYSKAEMPAGHRSIDLDLTPVITNATGIHYFMVLLEGSPFGPLSILKYMKARIESIEILATYIETGSYIGVSAAAGKDSVSFLSSPRAAGEWAYAITTYNDSFVPAQLRFLGSGSITRLVRGGIADAGIYARVDADLVNVNGSILTCPIYSGWINPTTASFSMNWTISASKTIGLASVHLAFRVDVPSQGWGAGNNPGDIYTIQMSDVHVDGITSSGTAWTMVDMMANESAWSYASSTADGELTGKPLNMGDESIALRVGALSTTTPAASEKIYSARLLGPELDASTLRTETNSTLEFEFIPFISAPVAVSSLAGESARVRVVLELHVNMWGSYSPLVTFVVDEFTITPDNFGATRFAWADISPYLGVPVGIYGGYINKVRIGVSITIDIADTRTPGVTWGCEARNYMLSVVDLPSRPQFIGLPQVIHGNYPIWIRGQGDEVHLWLDYAVNNGPFIPYTDITQKVPGSLSTWRVWFDSTAFDDTSNLSLRVYMQDSVGLRNTEHVLEVTGLCIDNTAPEIASVTGLHDNMVLGKNTNISVVAASPDAAAVMFQFVPAGETWASSHVITFMDDEPSDGFSHALMIYALAEGTYNAKVTLLDGAMDVAQSDSLEFFNITIIHAYPEIISPLPATVTNGHLLVQARTGTMNVLGANLYTGISADQVIDHVSSWTLAGSSTWPVNGSFAFQLDPVHFGSIESWVFILVNFTISDTLGGIIVDSASVLIYVDTITPQISIDFAAGHSHDANGYIKGVPVFSVTTTTPDQIARVEIRALQPDSEMPVVIASSESRLFPWYYTFVPSIDGLHNFQAVAVDVAGNMAVSDVLSTTIDSRPLVLHCTSPALNQSLWYNQSAVQVVIPIEIYSADCDINASSLGLEYKWVHSATWTTYQASWGKTSSHSFATEWSINTTLLDPYPFYQFRVTASDYSSTAYTYTSTLLVTVNDTIAPRIVRFTNNLESVVWGNTIALEIEALDDVLFVEVWNRTPGTLYDFTDEDGLIARLYGNGAYHALANSSSFAQGLIYLRAVDHAFNQNTTVIPVIIMTAWSCNILDGSFIKTANGTLEVISSVRETDLEGIELSLYQVINGSREFIKSSTSCGQNCIACFTSLASGSYVLAVRIKLNPALTIFPTSWLSSYIPDIHFTIDDISPTNVVIANVLDYTVVSGGEIRLNASAIDNSGRVSLFISVNGTIQSLSEFGHVGDDGFVYWTGAGILPDGEYEIRLIAIDAAGNNASATATQHVIIDNSPACIESITSSPNPDATGLILTSDTVTLTFSATDNVSMITGAWVDVVLPTGMIAAWSQGHNAHAINATATFSFKTLGFAAGAYTIHVYVNGSAGLTIKPMNIVFDDQAPGAWFVSPLTDAIIVGENLTLVIGCSDIAGIKSVLVYRGLPGAGGILLGQALPYEASMSTWYHVLQVDSYSSSSYFALVTDLLGHSSVATVDRVMTASPLILTTALLNGANIGSPVDVSGQCTIEPGVLDDGTNLQVGAWYGVPDSAEWIYLKSSSTFMYSPSGPGTTSYPYTISFDTDLITGISSSQYVPIALAPTYWTNDLYSAKLTGFAGDFDGQGDVEIIYTQIVKVGSNYKLRVYAVKKVFNGWAIQQGPTGQYFEFPIGSFASYSLLDMTTCEIEGKSKIVLLDNQYLIHIIGYGESGLQCLTQALPTDHFDAFTAMDFDAASQNLVFGVTTGTGSAAWLWALPDGDEDEHEHQMAFDDAHVIPVLSTSMTLPAGIPALSIDQCVIASIAVDNFALAGVDLRPSTLFGTSNAFGYVDAAKAVHIIDTGFSVTKIACGDIDVDGKNEILLGVSNHAGHSVLIAYAWAENAGSLAWHSSIITDYGTLAAFTSFDIGLGLPENPGEDLIVASSIGVVNYQLKSAITETIIPVQPGSWISRTTDTTVNGRYDTTSQEMAPFSSVKGTETMPIDGVSSNDVSSTVVINEFGFRKNDGSCINFIELYNWGSEEVDLSGLVINVTPSTLDSGFPHYTPLPRSYRFPLSAKIRPRGFVILTDQASSALIDPSATVFDVGLLLADWLGWETSAGHYYTWHDITIEFAYDNYRTGDWFDDCLLIELAKLNNIDHIPVSIYRSGMMDTNKEYDFAIGEAPATIGELNPGQDVDSWSANPSLTYHRGDAAIYGLGIQQLAAIDDGSSSSFTGSFAQTAASGLSNDIGYYYSGAADTASHTYTSTQNLHTASGNQISGVSTGSNAGNGLPTQFPGWTGNVQNVYDNVYHDGYRAWTTSIETASQTWMDYQNQFFILPGLGVTSNVPYWTERKGPSYVPNIPENGKNLYNGYLLGAQTDLAGIGGVDITKIDDSSTLDDEYMISHLMYRDSYGTPLHSQTFGASYLLHFDLDQRIDPQLITDQSSIAIHVTAIGIMEVVSYYQSYLVHSIYTIPINIKIGGLGLITFGQPKFLSSNNEYSGWTTESPPSGSTWSDIKEESAYKFDQIITGETSTAALRSELEQGRGDITLTLTQPSRPQDSQIEGVHRYWGYNVVPRWLNGDVEYSAICNSGGDAYSIERVHLYIEQAYIEVNLAGNSDKDLETHQIDVTIPSPTPSAISISAVITDFFWLDYGTSGWDGVDVSDCADAYSNSFTWGYYGAVNAPVYNNYYCQGLYDARWTNIGANPIRHIEILVQDDENPGEMIWTDLDLTSVDGTFDGTSFHLLFNEYEGDFYGIGNTLSIRFVYRVPDIFELRWGVKDDHEFTTLRDDPDYINELVSGPDFRFLQTNDLLQARAAVALEELEVKATEPKIYYSSQEMLFDIAPDWVNELTDGVSWLGISSVSDLAISFDHKEWIDIINYHTRSIFPLANADPFKNNIQYHFDYSFYDWTTNTWTPIDNEAPSFSTWNSYGQFTSNVDDPATWSSDARVFIGPACGMPGSGIKIKVRITLKWLGDAVIALDGHDLIGGFQNPSNVWITNRVHLAIKNLGVSFRYNLIGNARDVKPRSAPDITVKGDGRIHASSTTSVSYPATLLISDLGMVINEIVCSRTGSFIELANYGPRVDISNYYIRLFIDTDYVGDAYLLRDFIPVASDRIMEPSSLKVIEGIPAGCQTYMVVLFSDNGTPLDVFIGAWYQYSLINKIYIFPEEWIGTTTETFPYNIAARNCDDDTNTPADWSARAVHTLGAWNPGQEGVAKVGWSHVTEAFSVTEDIDMTACIAFKNVADASSIRDYLIKMKVTDGLTGQVMFTGSETKSFTPVSAQDLTVAGGCAQVFEIHSAFIDSISVSTKDVINPGTRPSYILLHLSEVGVDGKPVDDFTAAFAELNKQYHANTMLVSYEAFCRLTMGTAGAFAMTELVLPKKRSGIDPRTGLALTDLDDFTVMPYRKFAVELYAVIYHGVGAPLTSDVDHSFMMQGTGVAGTGAFQFNGASWQALDTNLVMSLACGNRSYLVARKSDLDKAGYRIRVPKEIIPSTLFHPTTTVLVQSWATGFPRVFTIDAWMENAFWYGTTDLEARALFSVSLDVSSTITVSAKVAGSSVFGTAPAILKEFTFQVSPVAEAIVIDLDASFDVEYWTGDIAAKTIMNMDGSDKWEGTTSRVSQSFVPASASLDEVTIWVESITGSGTSPIYFCVYETEQITPRPFGIPILKVDITGLLNDALASSSGSRPVTIGGIKLALEYAMSDGHYVGKKYAFSIENYEGRVVNLAYGPDTMNSYPDGDMSIMQNGEWQDINNDMKFIARFSSIASVRGAGADELYALLKNNGGGTKSLVQIKTASGQWLNMILTSRATFSEAPDFTCLELGTGMPLLTFVYPLAKGATDVVDGTGSATIRIAMDYTSLIGSTLTRPGIAGYRAYFGPRHMTARVLSNGRTSAETTSTAVTECSVTVEAGLLKDLDSIALDVVGQDVISASDENGEVLASNQVISPIGKTSLDSGQLQASLSSRTIAILPRYDFTYSDIDVPFSNSYPYYDPTAQNHTFLGLDGLNILNYWTRTRQTPRPPVIDNTGPLGNGFFYYTQPVMISGRSVYQITDKDYKLHWVKMCLAASLYAPAGEPRYAIAFVIDWVSDGLLLLDFLDAQDSVLTTIRFSSSGFVALTKGRHKIAIASHEPDDFLLDVIVDGVIMATVTGGAAALQRLRTLRFTTGEQPSSTVLESGQRVYLEPNDNRCDCSIDDIDFSWKRTTLASEAPVSLLDFKSGFGNYVAPVKGSSSSYTLRAMISSTLVITSTRALPVTMHHTFQVASINVVVRSSEFEAHEVPVGCGMSRVQIVDLDGDYRPDILLDSGIWARSEGTDRVYKIKIQAHLAGQPANTVGLPIIRYVFVSAQAPRPRLLVDASQAFDQCGEFIGTPSKPAQFAVKLPENSGTVVHKVVEFDVWLFRDASAPAGIIIKLLNRFSASLFDMSFMTSTTSTTVAVLDLHGSLTSLEFDPSTWIHVRIHFISPTSAEVWIGNDHAILPCFASADNSGIWSVGITSTTTSRVDNIACSWNPSIIDFTGDFASGTPLTCTSSNWQEIDTNLASTGKILADALHPQQPPAEALVEVSYITTLAAYVQNIHTTSVSFACKPEGDTTWTPIGVDATADDSIFSVPWNSATVSNGLCEIKVEALAEYEGESFIGSEVRDMYICNGIPYTTLAPMPLDGVDTFIEDPEATTHYEVSMRSLFDITNTWYGAVRSLTITLTHAAGLPILWQKTIKLHGAASSDYIFSLEPFWALNPTITSVELTAQCTSWTGMVSSGETIVLTVNREVLVDIPATSTLSYGDAIAGSIVDGLGIGHRGLQVDVAMDDLYYGSCTADMTGHFALPLRSLDVYSESLLDISKIAATTDIGAMRYSAVSIPSLTSPGTFVTSDVVMLASKFVAGATISAEANIAEAMCNMRAIKDINSFEGIAIDLLIPRAWSYSFGTTAFEQITITFTTSTGMTFPWILSSQDLLDYFMADRLFAAADVDMDGGQYELIRVPIPFSALQCTNTDMASAVAVNPDAFDPASICSVLVSAKSAAVYLGNSYVMPAQVIGIAGIHLVDVLKDASTWRVQDIDGNPAKTHKVSYSTSSMAWPDTTILTIEPLETSLTIPLWGTGTGELEVEYSDYLYLDQFLLKTSGNDLLTNVRTSTMLGDSMFISAIIAGDPWIAANPECGDIASAYQAWRSFGVNPSMTFQFFMHPTTMADLKACYSGNPFFLASSRVLASTFTINRETTVISSDLGISYGQDAVIPSNPAIKASFEENLDTCSDVTFTVKSKAGTTITPAFHDGVFGSCLALDSDAYIQTSFLDGFKSMTLTANIYVSTIDSKEISIFDSRAMVGDIQLERTSVSIDSTSLHVSFNDGKRSWHRGFTSKTWYYISVVFDVDASVIRAYVDGEYIGVYGVNFDMLAPDASYNTFQIGRTVRTGDCLKGYIDEVVVYERALTASEIKLLGRTSTRYDISAGEGRYVMGRIFDNDGHAIIPEASGTPVPSSFKVDRMTYDLATKRNVWLMDQSISPVVPTTQETIDTWSGYGEGHAASRIMQVFQASRTRLDSFAFRTCDDGDSTNDPTMVSINLVMINPTDQETAGSVLWAGTGIPYSDFTGGRVNTFDWFERSGVNYQGLIIGQRYGIVISADTGQVYVEINSDSSTDRDKFYALEHHPDTSWNAFDLIGIGDAMAGVGLDLSMRLTWSFFWDVQTTGVVLLDVHADGGYHPWTLFTIGLDGSFGFTINTAVDSPTYLAPGIYEAKLIYDPAILGGVSSDRYKEAELPFTLVVGGGKSRIDMVDPDPNKEKSTLVEERTYNTSGFSADAGDAFTYLRATRVYSDAATFKFKLTSSVTGESLPNRPMWLQIGLIPSSLSWDDDLYASTALDYIPNDRLIDQYLPSDIIEQTGTGKPGFYPYFGIDGGATTLYFWGPCVWTYSMTDASGVATFTFDNGLPVRDIMDIANEIGLIGEATTIDDMELFLRVAYNNAFSWEGMGLSTLQTPGQLMSQFEDDGDDRQWFDGTRPGVDDGFDDPLYAGSYAMGKLILDRESVMLTGSDREVNVIEQASGIIPVDVLLVEADVVNSGLVPEPEDSGADGYLDDFREPSSSEVVYMRLKDEKGDATLIDESYLQGTTGQQQSSPGLVTINLDPSQSTIGYLPPGIYTCAAFTQGNAYLKPAPEIHFNIVLRSDTTYNLSQPSITYDFGSALQEDAIPVKGSNLATMLDYLGQLKDPDMTTVDIPVWEAAYPMLIGSVAARNLTSIMAPGVAPDIAWDEYQDLVDELETTLGHKIVTPPAYHGFVPDGFEEADFIAAYYENYPEEDGFYVQVFVNGIAEAEMTVHLPDDASNWTSFYVDLKNYNDLRFIDLDNDGEITSDEWVSGERQIDTDWDGQVDTWIDWPLNVTITVQSLANYTNKELLIGDFKIIDSAVRSDKIAWDLITEFPRATPLGSGYFNENHVALRNGSFAVKDPSGNLVTFDSIYANFTRDGPAYDDIFRADVTTPLWAPFIDRAGERVIDDQGLPIYGTWGSDKYQILQYDGLSDESCIPDSGSSIEAGTTTADVIGRLLGPAYLDGMLVVKITAGAGFTDNQELTLKIPFGEGYI